MNIVIAQLRAPLYCPGVEFTNLVFTTSIGEDRSVAQNPAKTADIKWQGRSSKMDQWNRSTSDFREWLLVFSYQSTVNLDVNTGRLRNKYNKEDYTHNGKWWQIVRA